MAIKASSPTTALILFGWRRLLRRLCGFLLGLGRQFVAEFDGHPVSRAFLNERGTIADHAVFRKAYPAISDEQDWNFGHGSTVTLEHVLHRGPRCCDCTTYIY